MSGQLLEDDSGVYGEGMALPGYLGYREGLLPAPHGSKKKLHGVCGLLEKEVPRVYLHEFFLCAKPCTGTT